MKKIVLIIIFVFFTKVNLFSQTTEKFVFAGVVFGDQAGNVDIWNPGSITMPNIIEIDGGYRMYYNMSCADSVHIRYAESPDGITWTDGGVVMKNDSSRSSRKWIIGGPSVVKLTNGQYRMYYRCTQEYIDLPKYHVRSAISDDGINFTEEPGVRVEIFPYDTLSEIVLAGHGKWFINDAGEVTGIFSGNPKNGFGPSDLYVTLSSDGLTFTNFIRKYEDYHDPTIVKTENSYILYATYLAEKKGKAVSLAGITWPAEMDSVAFVDSSGNPMDVANDGIGDIDGIMTPNGEIWIYANYGIPSRDFALFKLSNPISSVNSDDTENIETIRLNQYPNPFNETSIISFNLPQRRFVKITVYNSAGELVSELTNGNFSAGYHQVKFEGKNLASGIYIYRIQAGDFFQSKKMLLLK